MNFNLINYKIRGKDKFIAKWFRYILGVEFFAELFCVWQFANYIVYK